MLDRKQILYLKLILHKELSRTSFMITFITFMISLVFPTPPLMLMTQGKYFHEKSRYSVSRPIVTILSPSVKGKL